MVVLKVAGVCNLLNAALAAERLYLCLTTALKEGFVKVALDWT